MIRKIGTEPMRRRRAIIRALFTFSKFGMLSFRHEFTISNQDDSRYFLLSRALNVLKHGFT